MPDYFSDAFIQIVKSILEYYLSTLFNSNMLK